MSQLTNDIRSARKTAAENVILLDLRKKGLLRDNEIIKPVNGHALAREKDKWLNSFIGKTCMDTDLLYDPVEGLSYLKERLVAAFLAGANASISLINANQENNNEDKQRVE